MKLALFLFALISFSAQAANTNPPAVHPYDLMKCSTADRTVWISFGRIFRSGDTKPTYFPTEIVLFAPDFSARRVFLQDLEGAFKIPVRMREGGMAIEFPMPKGEIMQMNTIQVMVIAPGERYSFMGNWTISEPGKPDLMVQVGCTIK